MRSDRVGAMYLGGFDDIFDNCEDPSVLSININIQSILFQLAAENKRNLIPTLVLNAISTDIEKQSSEYSNISTRIT